ncbi:flavodoxin [Methanosphaera sp. WGK6]|nr:flavodoxin [Methanosphaera sp. WGK6]
MKIDIRYYTKSGHTEKLANAISEVINVPAKPISEKLDEDIDILFLGSSIYGNSIDPTLPKFFNDIDVNIGSIVSFSTAGVMESTYEQIVELANLYGISVDKREFHCRGEFAGINKGRPNSADVENIKRFVRDILD